MSCDVFVYWWLQCMMGLHVTGEAGLCNEGNHLWPAARRQVIQDGLLSWGDYFSLTYFMFLSPSSTVAAAACNLLSQTHWTSCEHWHRNVVLTFFSRCVVLQSCTTVHSNGNGVTVGGTAPLFIVMAMVWQLGVHWAVSWAGYIGSGGWNSPVGSGARLWEGSEW